MVACKHDAKYRQRIVGSRSIGQGDHVTSSVVGLCLPPIRSRTYAARLAVPPLSRIVAPPIPAGPSCLCRPPIPPTACAPHPRTGALVLMAPHSAEQRTMAMAPRCTPDTIPQLLLLLLQVPTAACSPCRRFNRKSTQASPTSVALLKLCEGPIWRRYQGKTCENRGPNTHY